MLPRILLIADVQNWVFDYHSQILKRYLSNAFQFEIKYRNQPFNEEEYDLIYPLEFDMVNPMAIKNPMKYVTGIRSHVSWSNIPFLDLVDLLNHKFQAVHVVSKKLYDIFDPYLNHVFYVTHGVDLELFKPQPGKWSPKGMLVAGFSGNRNAPIKGFEEFIEPIAQIEGVKLQVNGFADINLSKEQMPAYYAGLDAIVSASSFEGNNNTILEAAAMQCAIITTAHGTVPEILKNGYSALIVERDLHKIEEAVILLRDDPQMRMELGKNARKALLDANWGYAEKAKEFEQFFNDALNGLNNKIEPVKKEINYAHLCSVIEEQWQIEKELRRGLAGKIFQLTDGQDILTALAQKNKRIAELENYHAAEMIALNARITELEKQSKRESMVARVKRLLAKM
jgi:glycosyltransferase involved in cell wall biosynthesis